MQQRQSADSPQKGQTQAQASRGLPHRRHANPEESTAASPSGEGSGSEGLAFQFRPRLIGEKQLAVCIWTFLLVLTKMMHRCKPIDGLHRTDVQPDPEGTTGGHQPA